MDPPEGHLLLLLHRWPHLLPVLLPILLPVLLPILHLRLLPILHLRLLPILHLGAAEVRRRQFTKGVPTVAPPSGAGRFSIYLSIYRSIWEQSDEAGAPRRCAQLPAPTPAACRCRA